MDYETLLVDVQNGVGVVTLNRPDAMNALNQRLAHELGEVIDDLDADSAVGCIVLTGGERVFAAGADIKEMQGLSFHDLFKADFPRVQRDCWRAIDEARTPIIAAVAGFALGGGCELALACDFIVAADTAKFGQPEIAIGTMPGAGGTQRLTKAIGKAKAMDMCLTGRMMDVDEAERAGLVSQVVPADTLLQEVHKIAQKIANHSRPAAMMIKEAVNFAVDADLTAGLLFERRHFAATFAFEDCKEGMTAFAEKRKPTFKHR